MFGLHDAPLRFKPLVHGRSRTHILLSQVFVYLFNRAGDLGFWTSILTNTIHY